MKRCIRLICCLLALLAPGCAFCDGLTLRTASCFAGAYAAADAYVQLLRAFEEPTG